MDNENPAGTEVAETQAPDFVEIPLDQLGLTDEELQAATHPEGEVAEEVATEAATPAAEAPAADDDVRGQLLRLQQDYADLQQRLEPLTRSQQQQPNQWEQHFQALHEKMLNQSMTRQEWAQYQDMREQRLAARLESVGMRNATLASSEQTARGVFTDEAMGKGHSYDTLTAKHLDRAFRADPALRTLLPRLVPNQPAEANYLWSTMAEVLEQCEWNVARACKMVLGAMNAPATAAGEIQTRLRRSQASGANKIHGADTTVAAGKAKVENFWDLPDKAFDRIVAQADIG